MEVPCKSFKMAEKYFKKNKTVLPLKRRVDNDKQCILIEVVLVGCGRCPDCLGFIGIENPPMCLYHTIQHLLGDFTEGDFVRRVGKHSLYKGDDNHYMYEYIL